MPKFPKRVFVKHVNDAAPDGNFVVEADKADYEDGDVVCIYEKVRHGVMKGGKIVDEKPKKAAK